MSATVVDRLQADFSDMLEVLSRAGEISLMSSADENLRKALLLSAASYFENLLCKIVLDFVSEATSEHPLITSLVHNKAIIRQYHTWFDWNAKNANVFFSLFGSTFCNFMKQKVKNDTSLDISVRAFLEIGSERNRLVHQDFGSFPLEKTSKEIYELYLEALKFVSTFQSALEEFCSNLPTTTKIQAGT